MFHGRYNIFLLIALWQLNGCAQPPQDKRERQGERGGERIERLAGAINVAPSATVLERGRVLMSYADCFTCHKESDRKRGPAFTDIAARYPMNSTYIEVLARRVVLGTKGSWGNAVMPPHPKVSVDDATAMVSYILSLD